MTWLEDCRPFTNIGGKQADDHWNRLFRLLDGTTFVKYVDPEIGKAIINSIPVQAITKDWIAYVNDMKDSRVRMAMNIVKGDRDTVQGKHDLFNMLDDPDHLEAGGTKENVKRLRAIAMVMKDELGYINDTWLADIMYACTGRPYNRENIKPHTKDMK